ncbi:MAG: hypothetical protein ACYTF6_08685 [Planctomycetota bacterium]|jgi:hypothetical protein
MNLAAPTDEKAVMRVIITVQIAGLLLLMSVPAGCVIVVPSGVAVWFPIVRAHERTLPAEAYRLNEPVEDGKSLTPEKMTKLSRFVVVTFWAHHHFDDPYNFFPLELLDVYAIESDDQELHWPLRLSITLWTWSSAWGTGAVTNEDPRIVVMAFAEDCWPTMHGEVMYADKLPIAVERRLNFGGGLAREGIVRCIMDSRRFPPPWHTRMLLSYAAKEPSMRDLFTKVIDSVRRSKHLTKKDRLMVLESLQETVRASEHCYDCYGADDPPELCGKFEARRDALAGRLTAAVEDEKSSQ